ncbi:MAG: LytTR family DNA-binding domain-containing protein [Lentimicrobiaceae bacterium]|nr:LytTR family DNA-binding domain-containing protein [Lentimicrobiaceae bacterium]
MKKLFSRISSCFYFWNYTTSSYSKKREKALKGLKYRPQKREGKSTKKADLIVFKDDKGTVCFSIQIAALLYIVSDTNYITVYYTNQGKLEKHFMRTSLRMVLEQNQNPNLVRCHRSYIVNFEKVKMYKKDKEGGIIELSDDNAPSIPVSKSYIDNVLTQFQIQ